MKKYHFLFVVRPLIAIISVAFGLFDLSAQNYTVVFSDDFSSNTINTNKYIPDAPFFEGGKGDIHATAHDGVIEFVGTTTQQWWSGGTLQIAQTFTATQATPVAISIDRVAEAGMGSASRSALWILDETKTKYILFAYNRENGWQYNTKIGDSTDVPTGGGTKIPAFAGATFDDLGLHHMRMVANGSTVQLFLDGIMGAELKFPFSKVILEFGSYARANNDTADTTWDNLKVETVVPQQTVVFSDDFSSNLIDTNRYQPDAPFFEGGTGNIHATAHDGVIEFVGMTSQQWWSGGTLRIVPTFAPSESQTITLSIDRVAEAGMGTASRSALWILDSTKTKYVLFADNRENGWQYNRKIGEDGDVPTGGGTKIPAFAGATFDDLGLHRMQMVADGRTVKLGLDGIIGAEVKFPFSPVIFEFGSYARANNDTADTTWDNLKIESVGAAAFAPTDVSVRAGATSPQVTVAIPLGFNAQTAVSLQVISSDPTIAIPDGGTAGALTLNFPAGGTNVATFRVRGVALGGTTFTIGGGLKGGNSLSVAVISGPGVQLQENFSSNTLDPNKWQVSNQPFETAPATFTATPGGGKLTITGSVGGDGTMYWGGASLKTVKSYLATRDLNLAFDVDRVSIDQPGTAARTGVFITTADRSKFVFFSQDAGENNWQVNVNPGSPTGNQASIPAFSTITDNGNHHIRMVANGKTVEVFLDGVSGGTYPFEVTTGIFFEVATYGRASGDNATGVFANVKIENLLPCTAVSVASVSMTQADSGQPLTITIPQLLNDTAAASVTITSHDPKVAVPNGAANGVLTLAFPPGSPNSQTITVTPIGLGATTFDVATTPQNCSPAPVTIEVVSVPLVLLTDDFTGKVIDPTKWVLDNTGFNPSSGGTVTADSAIILTNGQASIMATADTASWPGLALFTSNTYSATLTAPLAFEIDRVKLDFVLTTGTGAYEQTGIWVKDATGNFVFFTEKLAHNGRNFGWRYNKMTGAADDNPTDDGVSIPAFNSPKFNDQKNHHMKIVVNGVTAKLYLDGVFGAAVPFTPGQGLKFGFGAYVQSAMDSVTGLFAHAMVSGGSAPYTPPIKLSITSQGGGVVITWNGTGTLQSTDTLGSALKWTDVSPQPSGNTYTVPASALTQQKYYRVKN